MLIKKAGDIKSSEITDKQVYLNRRLFMKGAILAGTAAPPVFLSPVQSASDRTGKRWWIETAKAARTP
jgi:hypothetical protein